MLPNKTFPRVIYIGPDWTIVDDPEDAVMVKVVSANGDVKFGIPVHKDAELGGPGSGFTREEGHHGRPGKVGGSQSDNDSSYEIENKPKFYSDLWFDTRARMTSDEKEAVKNYTDGYYVLINNISRGKSIGSEFTQENIELAMTYRDSLDSFVENVEAPRNMIVYRGVGLKNELAIKKLTTVGETFSDPGFLSTSLSRSVGENFMDSWSTGGTDFLLKINVDKGQKVASIVGIAVSEMEMIFPRNTKFKVTSTSLQPQTVWMPEHWFVELEVEQ